MENCWLHESFQTVLQTIITHIQHIFRQANITCHCTCLFTKQKAFCFSSLIGVLGSVCSWPIYLKIYTWNVHFLGQTTTYVQKTTCVLCHQGVNSWVPQAFLSQCSVCAQPIQCLPTLLHFTVQQSSCSWVFLVKYWNKFKSKTQIVLFSSTLEVLCRKQDSRFTPNSTIASTASIPSFTLPRLALSPTV